MFSRNKNQSNLSSRSTHPCPPAGEAGFSINLNSGFRLGGRNDNRKSFTLIELLVVLALVAILSVVVVITLNPAELLKQARDSNRLSDLSTINTALNLFSTDVTAGFMGTSTVVYVSIPSASPTCVGLGLPALPPTYTYNCVTQANLRNTNGTGWIPVNFQQISSNSPISQLPVDPQNTTSTGNYYTYVTGGSWIITGIPESQKQKTESALNPNLIKFPGVIGMGNNLDISPLYNSAGLVGYWKFDEGSGTIAKDYSGYNADANVKRSGAGWASNCKSGGCLDLNLSYATTSGSHLDIGGEITLSVWVYPRSLAYGFGLICRRIGGLTAYPYSILHSSLIFEYSNGSVLTQPYPPAVNALTLNNWQHVAVTANSDRTSIKFYKNGRLVHTGAGNIIGSTGGPDYTVNFGSGNTSHLNGMLDDIRIYNRELSAGEISALYNAIR